MKRRVDEDDLEVRSGQPVVAAPVQDRFAEVAGPAGIGWVACTQMPRSRTWSWRFCPTPGRSATDLDPELGQLRGITDPGEQEQAR